MRRMSCGDGKDCRLADSSEYKREEAAPPTGADETRGGNGLRSGGRVVT
jgi:hypothetical protein